MKVRDLIEALNGSLGEAEVVILDPQADKNDINCFHVDSVDAAYEGFVIINMGEETDDPTSAVEEEEDEDGF